MQDKVQLRPKKINHSVQPSQTPDIHLHTSQTLSDAGGVGAALGNAAPVAPKGSLV